MHIAILVTNTDTSEFAMARPLDGEKFTTLLHSVRPDWQVSVFKVTQGEFPDQGARFDGWLIGGSPASVHDKDPWITQLMGLIRHIVAEGQPLFGACFGHQAIALALGGAVGPNPGGWVFGLVDTEMQGQDWRLYGCHKEQVLHLPKGATPLGGNADCAHGSFAIADKVMTTQYHPEMTHEFICDLLNEYARKLPEDVVAKARQSLKTPADSPRIAQRIARFFEQASTPAHQV